MLREAAAEARTVLIELASDFLKVPVSRLMVKEGMVIDQSHPDKKASYGQLAKGKRIEKTGSEAFPETHFCIHPLR
jgi:hypothetical protein